MFTTTSSCFSRGGMAVERISYFFVVKYLEDHVLIIENRKENLYYILKTLKCIDISFFFEKSISMQKLNSKDAENAVKIFFSYCYDF